MSNQLPSDSLIQTAWRPATHTGHQLRYRSRNSKIDASSKPNKWINSGKRPVKHEKRICIRNKFKNWQTRCLLETKCTSGSEPSIEPKQTAETIPKSQGPQNDPSTPIQQLAPRRHWNQMKELKCQKLAISNAKAYRIHNHHNQYETPEEKKNNESKVNLKTKTYMKRSKPNNHPREPIAKELGRLGAIPIVEPR